MITKTVVIVGGGFSGAITAVQILRQKLNNIRVILIDRTTSVGRGLAYSTTYSECMLNVPAGNMSAFPNEPDHFVKYCQERGLEVNDSSFVSRAIFGDYIYQLLDNVKNEYKKESRFELITAEVIRLESNDSGALVQLDDHSTIRADRVVIASGHFSPITIPSLIPVITSERYQDAAHADKLLKIVGGPDPILLIGTGLTSLDVALQLRHQGQSGKIYLLSRRGLLPQPHRVHTKKPDTATQRWNNLLNIDPTAKNYLREVRNQISISPLDWRDIVGSLRSITPKLWMVLPGNEKRRFLRHIQPYWDTHRHRVAPEAYIKLIELIDNSSIEVIAGKITGSTCNKNSIELDIKLRKTQNLKHLKASYIINCTGPNSNLRTVESKLFLQLQKDGLIQLDEHGLGILVDEYLSVKNSAGEALSWLSYVGPFLKANYWEATAVPELRAHIEFLANKITNSLDPFQ